MIRIPVIVLVTAMPSILLAQTTVCLDGGTESLNESYLDNYYESSSISFAMSVISVDKNTRSVVYEVIQPVLKGEISDQVSTRYAEGCEAPKHLNPGVVYIAFLTGTDDKLTNNNAIFFSLSSTGPGYSWVAEWIENKAPNTYEVSSCQQAHETVDRECL